MKKSWGSLVVFGLLAISYGPYCPCVRAHGTAYRVMDDATTITAEFYYQDKEPMRYAEVLVFSPLDQKVEYQNGRTDRYGRFAFCPEMAGTWRIEVNDGMGHMVRGNIEVGRVTNKDVKSEPNDTHVHSKSGERTSTLAKTAFGLSLIFNMVTVVYLWKRKYTREKRG